MSSKLLLVLLAVISGAIANTVQCPTFFSLPRCTPGESTYDTTAKCFTCRACSDANATYCASKAVVNATPTCARGDLIYVKENCCPSCYVRRTNGTSADPICDAARLDQCRVSYPTLPNCTTGQIPIFNRSTCCVDCKVPPPPAIQPVQNLCTELSRKICLNETRACSGDEDPVPVRGSCCPSCIPPQWFCTRTAVAECLNDQEVCEEGTTPTVLDGACCRGCREKIPTCTPACANNEVCVGGRNATRSCKPRFCPAIRIVATTAPAEVKEAWRNASCTERCFMLKEAVVNFCDTTGAQEAHQGGSTRCDRLQAVIGAWDCLTIPPTCTSLAEEYNFKLSICFPRPENTAPATSKRSSRLANFFLSSAAGTSSEFTSLISDAAEADGMGLTLDGAASKPAHVFALVISIVAMAVLRL